MPPRAPPLVPQRAFCLIVPSASTCPGHSAAPKRRDLAESRRGEACPADRIIASLAGAQEEGGGHGAVLVCGLRGGVWGAGMRGGRVAWCGEGLSYLFSPLHHIYIALPVLIDTSQLSFSFSFGLQFLALAPSNFLAMLPLSFVLEFVCRGRSSARVTSQLLLLLYHDPP